MTIGFRIRDARNGQVVVDLADRLTRITGSGTTVAGVAGSFAIPDHNDGKPFFVCPGFNLNYSAGGLPDFTLNELTGVLSWTATPIATPFYVGVY